MLAFQIGRIHCQHCVVRKKPAGIIPSIPAGFPFFIIDYQITPVIFKMIWAMIVEPRNVPANVKIATTTIANPCFLKVSTSFPMEIPAYARIGVQSGRSPIFPICSIA